MSTKDIAANTKECGGCLRQVDCSSFRPNRKVCNVCNRGQGPKVRQDDLTQACADVMPAVLRWNLGDGLALDKTPRQIVEFMLSLQQMKEVDGNSKADPFCHGCRKLLSLVCFTASADRYGDAFCANCFEELRQSDHDLDLKEGSGCIWSLLENSACEKLRIFVSKMEARKCSLDLKESLPSTTAVMLTDSLSLEAILDEMNVKALAQHLHQAGSIASASDRCKETLIEAFKKDYLKGTYSTFNFVRASDDGFLATIYDEYGPKYPHHMQMSMNATTDKARSSLLLLGAEGHGTGWQRHCTEAKNIAYLLDPPLPTRKTSEKPTTTPKAIQLPLQKIVLALWVFVIPGKENIVEAWLAGKGLQFGKEPWASLPDLEQLCSELGLGADRSVIALYQMHGQMVHVPPGYAHCVHNLQPCIKLAWDLYNPANFPAYMTAMQLAGGKYFGKANANNRMGSEVLVVDIAVRAVSNEERFTFLSTSVKGMTLGRKRKDQA